MFRACLTFPNQSVFFNNLVTTSAMACLSSLSLYTLALRETLCSYPPSSFDLGDPLRIGNRRRLILDARMRHDSPIIERNSVPDRLTAPRATAVGAEYASLANVYERCLCNLNAMPNQRPVASLLCVFFSLFPFSFAHRVFTVAATPHRGLQEPRNPLPSFSGVEGAQ